MFNFIGETQMAKNEKTKINQIFEDLENYLNFCRDYGYRYDEADLYNNRSYVYRQYNKFVAGKEAKDMWAIDSK